MSRPPKVLQPTASLTSYFGAELRRRRNRCGWTQQDLADRVLHSVDLIRKVEAAQRFPSLEMGAACDAVLGADGALIRLWPLVEREQASTRARRHAGGDDIVVVAAESDSSVLARLVETGSDIAAEPGDDDTEHPDQRILDELRLSDRITGAAATYPQLLARLEVGLESLAARAAVSTGRSNRTGQGRCAA